MNLTCEQEKEKESEIIGNEEDIRLEEAKEEWQKVLDEWENHKNNKKRKVQHNTMAT